ncbi:hypothetical protein [Polaribacter sp. SA4-12]|uniref:hypothetical protein n=1 Tax=Polaribacter sp. SA4-12 TaxID=1312072 RepID=UPI000B3C4901|nr:hypothetical protein [Polaribacter sp. SA4-12]ARV14976.1 hypothetical protein BTO07_07365 [Polaribacter sp. SA4-12]
MVFFYVLGCISFVAIVIYFFIYKDRLNDKNSLEKEWQRFLKSESLNYIKGIAANGDKLIWNTALQSKQLDKIIEVVKARVSKYPELKKLENNAFNKKLHQNRPLRRY